MRLILKTFHKKQHGFSLMEVIMGMAIIGTVMAFVIRMNDDQLASNQGRIKAEEFSTFQQLAAQYFSANRTEMLAAMGETTVGASAQSHCVIKVTDPNQPIAPGSTPATVGANGTLAWSNDLDTCAFDATLLIAKRVWPNGVPINFIDPDVGGDWRYVAIFKRVMGAGPDGVLGNADDALTENVEMLVLQMDVDGALGTVSPNLWRADSRRRIEAESQRSILGASGGTMPIGNVGWCQTTQAQTDVCGNGWTVNLQRFLDATQLATVRSALPAN
jgi:prepilin-type N-terminal cleavage/methylation domain-containing protein